MVTQYSNSSVPSTCKSLFYSKIGLLDQYVIMCTDEYEYTLLMRNIATGEIQQYQANRVSQSGYNSYYEIQEISNPTWDYQITQEYYVYSNDGQGIMESLPIHSMIASWAVTGLVCLLAMIVVFKGALYPCLRRRK